MECAKEMKTENNTKFNQDFFKSCLDAMQCFHEVNLFINRYKEDSEHEKKIQHVCKKMKNMTKEDLLTPHGILLVECNAKFKRMQDERYTDNCYIMGFQSRILIFKIIQPKKNVEQYDEVASIKVSNSMSLICEEVSDSSGVITIRTEEDFIVDPNESFSFKLPHGTDFKKLKMEFQRLIDSAPPNLCKKHRGHKFCWSRTKQDIELDCPQPPPTCGECGFYIFGLLFLGYKCESCDKEYHENCFLKGKPDAAFSKSEFDI